MEARFEELDTEVLGHRRIDKVSSSIALVILGSLFFLYAGAADSFGGKMVAFSSCVTVNLVAMLAAGLYRFATYFRGEVPRGIWILLGVSGMVGQTIVLFLAGVLSLGVCGVFSLAGAITALGAFVSIPASLWFSPLIKDMDERGARWEVGWWLLTVTMQAGFVVGFVQLIWPTLETISSRH